MDGPGVGGMEGQGDHGLYLAQIDGDHLIIVGNLAGMQFLVVLRALVGFVEAACDLICLPNGAEAGGFGGHHVDAVTEVDGQFADAGTYKLQYLIVHKAALKGSLHQCDGHIVGADAPAWLAGQIDHDRFRHGSVPSVF